MPAPTLVIVNPRSGGGATARRWPKVEPLLADAVGPFEVAETQCPRDGIRIAREAARAGVTRLVTAGGDGTVSEVVSGVLEADLASRVEVGILPMGSGGDFPRTFGLPRDLPSAVAALGSGQRRRVDAGRLRFDDQRGEPAEAFFVNVASFGISGLVDEMVNRAPKTLGGTAAFAIGALRAITQYRGEPVCIRVDGEVVHDGPLTLAAAANGRYFGGGMYIAPGSEPDDGHLEVVVVAGLSTARMLAYFPSLYRGTHLAKPVVSVHRGKRVEAEAAPGRVWLDVDGEPLGTLPAEIEILPRAITLFGIPPESAGA